MRRSAVLLIWFSITLLLAPLALPTTARAAAKPSSTLEFEPPEAPFSSPFLASAVHALVCPDGSVLAQAAFLAPNYTLRVRGIKPEEVGYPDQGFHYPHGLEVLVLWARKGTPPLWETSFFTGGHGLSWGGGLLPLIAGFGLGGHGLPALGPAQASPLQPPEPPDKEKVMSILFSPGLWLGMFFVGLPGEQGFFEAKADQVASSVSAAYGVEMWLYLSFVFPLRPTSGPHGGEGPRPPWPEDLTGFIFIYYADVGLDDVAEGFVEQLPDGTPCELVKNTTRMAESPYVLLAYAMMDIRLVALLNMTEQYFTGPPGEHFRPWHIAPLDYDFSEQPPAAGWLTVWFSDRFVPSGIEENPDGTYTLSLNALFGHSGPICAGEPPDIPEDTEALAILLVDVPWWMEVVSVEPEEANMTCLIPHFTAVFLKLKRGECVDDLLVVMRPRKSFPIVLLRQYADSYIVEPGEEATITVCAENVGNATAYNVMCIVVNYERGHDHFWGEEEPEFLVLELGDIPPGHTASASFTVRLHDPMPLELEPATAIYSMVPFKLELGEESGEELYEYVWMELEEAPYPLFWCESNSIRLLTPGEEGSSLLAFLEFDRYIVGPGGPVRATLTIENVGNAPAENITIGGIVSSFWRGWEAYGGGVSDYGEIGYVKRIGPGEEVRLNLTVPEEELRPPWEEAFGPVFGLVDVDLRITPEGGGGVWSNTAKAIVMAKTEDVWRPGFPYVIVEKSASKTHVRRGEVFTITLHVSNVGTATAYDILIVEKLPHGLTYVGNARSHPAKMFTATANATHVVIYVSSLAPGEAVDISFDVMADEPGTYVLGSSPYRCESSLGSLGGLSDMLVVVVEEPGTGTTAGALITPVALGLASIAATLAIGIYLTRRREG